MIGRLLSDARDVIHGLLAVRHVARAVADLDVRLTNLEALMAEFYLGPEAAERVRNRTSAS